ncbi:hypothetical protein TM48_00401 [Mycobacterium shottsii]|uniref:Integrase n=1 Tax=Mycobacterium shottsii TaxID=133549 RepID=A0A7I7L7Z2_9MYCO|nr:hypothetical protein [Mycobacterium shottsii]QYL26323.1 hypothetical protein TM48_00401 [Mycobacterium shottsii]BBX55780.1 hypothetical protein MSHO_11250 [Mycobacterium shottsii]
MPHSIHKSVVTAVERAMGLEASARQAGHSSSEITRRHYVEQSVTVPDYTAAWMSTRALSAPFKPSNTNRQGNYPA